MDSRGSKYGADTVRLTFYAVESERGYRWTTWATKDRSTSTRGRSRAADLLLETAMDEELASTQRHPENSIPFLASRDCLGTCKFSPFNMPRGFYRKACCILH